MEIPKAFIFDLNGTMIDDMDFHTKAWHHIINTKLGGSMSWDEVKKHMYGKNEEVLARIFGPDRFSAEEVQVISAKKESRYREEFLPHLALLPGLHEFLQNASEYHIKMAIGSAAIPFNIDFVLDNLAIRQYFQVIVSADEVLFSKPDPETFLKAAGLLEVPPASCLVFEDAPKGVESALNAGMQCVVLTTAHGEEAFSGYTNIIGFIKDFTDPLCKELLGQAVQKAG